MHRPPTVLTNDLYSYMLTMGVHEAPELRALRDETLKLPNGHWAAAPEQAVFLQLLVRLLGAKRVIEVGTFTGYSTLALALALPEGGTVLTCDVAAGWSEMGTHYWRDAGVDKKIAWRQGRAVDILAELLEGGGRDSYDLIFLDADKRSYPSYLAPVADLLRPGGLLVVDNVFWTGRVVGDGPEDENLRGVRTFNQRLKVDPRFDIVMLPIADGMTLARKK